MKSSEAPPTMYRQADSDRVGGRKSGGSRKELKEKGQRHEWVEREQKDPKSI